MKGIKRKSEGKKKSRGREVKRLLLSDMKSTVFCCVAYSQSTCTLTCSRPRRRSGSDTTGRRTGNIECRCRTWW